MPPRTARTVGRPALYCRRSCRQRAFEARRRGQDLGASDDELVIARNELDDVNDRLFEITVAARDAQVQLDDGLDPLTVVRHLLEAVDGVVGSN